MANDNWSTKPLGDFVTLQRGHDLPDDKRRSGPIPILGSFGITGWHNQAKARGPGVTVGRSGASFGVVSYTEADYWPLNTALYVKDFHGNEARFAYYFLKSFDFSGYNSGSAQPSLNRNFIHPIPINVPPPIEQRAIAHVLGTLDDKIEINRRMNETLEAMARALFHDWFVAFGPTRAKMAGQEPYLPKHLWDLFPDSLTALDGEPLPDGWRNEKLGDLICRKKQKAKYTKDNVTAMGTVPVWEQGAGLLLGFHSNEPDFRVSPHAPIAIFGDHTCVMHLSLEHCSVGPNVIPFTGNDLPTLWAYHACLGKQVFQEYRRHWSEFIIKKAARPSSDDLPRRFASIVQPMSERMLRNDHESRTLSALRDTLLPKLISGELRVPDAERILERAS